MGRLPTYEIVAGFPAFQFRGVALWRRLAGVNNRRPPVMRRVGSGSFGLAPAASDSGSRSATVRRFLPPGPRRPTRCSPLRPIRPLDQAFATLAGCLEHRSCLARTLTIRIARSLPVPRSCHNPRSILPPPRSRTVVSGSFTGVFAPSRSLPALSPMRARLHRSRRRDSARRHRTRPRMSRQPRAHAAAAHPESSLSTTPECRKHRPKDNKPPDYQPVAARNCPQ